MALNSVTTAISDGGSGGGNFDLNIDAEKFYYGYKIIEKETPVFDELSNTVLSITDKVNSLGVNFSNISSKIKKDNSELNDMYNRMISFKKTLERIDTSNALLFSSLDTKLYADFSEEVTETDLALNEDKVKKDDNGESSILDSILKKIFGVTNEYTESSAFIAGMVTVITKNKNNDKSEGFFDKILKSGKNILESITGSIISSSVKHGKISDFLKSNGMLPNIESNIDKSSNVETLSSIKIIVDGIEYSSTELAKLSDIKIGALITKAILKGNNSEAISILTALPKNRMNELLKDANEESIAALFNTTEDISTLIQKIDTRNVTLLGKIAKEISLPVLSDNMSDQQIYRMIKSSNPVIFTFGEKIMQKLDEERIVTLFERYDYSNCIDRLFSNSEISSIIINNVGYDYIKEKYGQKILFEAVRNLSDSLLIDISFLKEMSEDELINYFNYLKDNNEIDKIVKISYSKYLYSDKENTYKYLKALLSLNNNDEIIKKTFKFFLFENVKTSDLYANLSEFDTDKLNTLFGITGIKAFEHYDGDKFFVKCAPEYNKIVDGKIIYAYWFSNKHTDDMIIYTDLEPTFVYSKESNEKLDKFLSETYFDYMRILNISLFEEVDGYLGNVVFDGKEYTYEYPEGIRNAIDELADNYVNFFRDGAATSMVLGVEQNSLNILARYNKAELKRISEDMAKRYNADVDMLEYALGQADTIDGICSYADFATKIFQYYYGREEDFLRDFGYPMYKETSTSNAKVFNTEELLADLYIFNNSSLNGKNLFTVDKNNNLVLTEKKVGTATTYMRGDKVKETVINENNFFEYHNIPVETNIIKYKYNTIDSETVEKINAEIIKGNYPSLITWYYEGCKDSPMTYEELNVLDAVGNNNLNSFRPTGYTMNTKDSVTYYKDGRIKENFGHITPIIGIDQEYVYIASWGNPYRIKISELDNLNSFIALQKMYEKNE